MGPDRSGIVTADELMAEEYLEHAVAPFGQAEPGTVDGPAHMRQTQRVAAGAVPDRHMTIEAIVAEDGRYSSAAKWALAAFKISPARAVLGYPPVRGLLACAGGARRAVTPAPSVALY